MKRLILLKSALAGAALAAAAGVNSPDAPGMLDRGRLMLAEGNWQGCIDRVRTLDLTGLNDADREQAAWLLAAASYLGGYDTAMRLLEDFTDGFPASEHYYNARLWLANSLLDSNTPRALTIYDSLAAVNPGPALDADLRYHRAYALMRLGEFDTARQAFKALAADDTYGSNARFYLGYIAYTERDYATAADYLGRVDRRSLPGAAADYYLAQIYYVKGDYSRALQASRTLIASPAASDPAYAAEAQRIAGESLFNLGDRDAALPYLRRYAAMTDSPEPSALYILGTAEYEAGNYRAAVDYLEPVTRQNSAMGQSAYLFVGEALMELGDKAAALLAFDAALRLDYDEKVREAAYYNYAVARFSGASVPFGSSVETFEAFLSRYPDGEYAPRVQEYLVAGYLTDNNYEAALASINRMTRPGDKVLAAKQQVLYALGTRALATDDATAARDYLQQALALERHDRGIAAATHLSLGEALYRLGDYDGAATHARAYLAAAPASDANYALGVYDLGYAEFGRKDYQAAAQAFARVVQSPGSLGVATRADALARLGDARLYSGDRAGARDSYADAYDMLPAAGDYPLYQLAVLRGYDRDYEGGIVLLDRLAAEFPTSSLIPDALLEKSEGYLQLGRRDDAIATYRSLIDAYPTTVQGRSGMVQLAMTCLGAGRRDEAIATYRRVVSDYPTSDEALVAVEELQRLAAQDGTLGEMAAFLEGIENAPQLDIAESDRLTFEAAEEIYVADGTVARLQRYLDEYPSGAYRAEAWAYLMEYAVSARNTGDALTYATLITDNYPDTRLAEDALAVKAAAEHSLGRGADALRTWTALAARASTPALLNRARTGMMRVALDMADYDTALANADALLASTTAGAEERGEATFGRGLALYMKGDVAAAREAWSAVASDTDDLNGVKAAFYMAQSYADEHDYDRAAAATESIIDSATPHTYWLARAFILLSDVYAATDRRFEAREYLRSLRDNYPGSDTDIFQMIDTRLNQLQ